MRRSLVILLLFLATLPMRSQGYGSINIDVETTAALTELFGAQYGAEALMEDDINEILHHYTNAEIATSGIFASKWLDRKAMKNAGLFSSEESYYYRRIYTMVSARIMPKIWDVASLMIKRPDKAIYWGPYLFKVTEDVRNLCMQFECIVTNGKLSFSGIQFLVFKDEIKKLFDLAKLGGVDWPAVWDKLTDFGSGLSKDDLKGDLDDLVSAGSAIATAGGNVLDSLWVHASKVGGIFHMKPKELWNLGVEYKDIFEDLAAEDGIKNALLGEIGSTDSIGVMNMFNLDHYNISQYLTDYVKDAMGQYYKQRWYIYWSESGYEDLCDWKPNTEISDNITYGRAEWTRFDTNSKDFYPSYDQKEQIKRKCEGYAGWSQARVDELNRSQNDYTYHIYYDLYSYYIYRNGDKNNIVGWSYAYGISVYRSWNWGEEVYEEWFDSQTMNLGAFQTHMNEKLVEMQMQDQLDNSVTYGDVSRSADAAKHTYRIGKDAKQYYKGASEDKLRGCTMVTFTSHCTEEREIGRGNLQLFCIEEVQGFQPLWEYLQLFDMNDGVRGDVANGLLGAWGGGGGGDILTNVMDSQAALFNIEWDGYGYFETDPDGSLRTADLPTCDGVGMWFHRLGHIRGSHTVYMDAEICRNNKAHRFWHLRSVMTSSHDVDEMTFDDGVSDAEKSRQVNQRLSQLQQDFPDCEIEVNYGYKNPNIADDKDDALHLLWVSDRLAIARDVDARLTKIYAQLVMLEKYMRSRETLLEYLKGTFTAAINAGLRNEYSNAAFRRWRESSRNAITNHLDSLHNH